MRRWVALAVLLGALVVTTLLWSSSDRETIVVEVSDMDLPFGSTDPCDNRFDSVRLVTGSGNEVSQHLLFVTHDRANAERLADCYRTADYEVVLVRRATSVDRLYFDGNTPECSELTKEEYDRSMGCNGP